MAFEETVGSLSSLLQIQPTRIVCDLHPDYLSSVYAAQSGLPVSTVQHHHAHLAACMAENRLDGDVIGLIFDGTGFGADGTLWGGEILVGGYGHFVRAGHFLPARLPGGDAAVREPWRMALAYLYQALGVRAFSSGHSIAAGLTDNEKSLFSVMLERGVNAPWSSSCGRLFDAVAALIGIRRNVSYDGQAAIELEALAELVERDSVFSSYPYSLIDASASDSPFQIDFRPMFPLIIADLDTGVLPAQIAWHFHCTVASASVTACIKCAERFALDRVVLSGGVFQNRLLTEMIYSALEQHGFIVHTHRLTPPNDGCISLGQAAVAGYRTQAL
jgi:hydrogenase maturation protein HypF